jgi:hypothetical protein
VDVVVDEDEEEEDKDSNEKDMVAGSDEPDSMLNPVTLAFELLVSKILSCCAVLYLLAEDRLCFF